MEYDDQSRVTAIEDGLGNRETWAYAEQGLLTSAVDATGLITSYEYGAMDRIVRSDMLASGVTLYDYDVAGQVSRIEDAQGRVSTYEYDAVDRMITSIDPDLIGRSFDYDEADNVIQVVDGRGEVTRFRFSLFEQMVERTDPLGNTRTHVYDLRSNLTRIRRTDGRSELATYNGRGQHLRRNRKSHDGAGFRQRVAIHIRSAVAPDRDDRPSGRGDRTYLGSG
nr:RHS repeat domain-containing protein [Pontibrevibacter nitratireducens]